MSIPSWQLCCPVPLAASADRITLAHGEGGRLMRQLLERHVFPRFGGATAGTWNDAASLERIAGIPVVTTDSFVVSPLFFPGGDIGRLAVNGTVNDLVVSGAKPRWLTLSLIMEEGFPIPLLEQILGSAASAARDAEVAIIAGDTKVVPRGSADGLFLNTAGIGERYEPHLPGAATLKPGDELIVSGPIGRHGIAILAAREQLGFDPPPLSDCAPLIEPARALREAALPIKAMRDATRGGVTAVLHEWAADCGQTLSINEACLPVTPDVRGICELLGLDPLHVANEGTMLVAVAAGFAQRTVDALRQCHLSASAAWIGTVKDRGVAPVTIQRLLGREQPLDEPSGALLPRIC